MRSLVILRGSPGAGKSTWIEKMGLKNYTLCADDIRMLVESPILTENGYRISQKNDNYVWSLLFELLEKRMSCGEFVIVDATHSRSSDFSRYNSLCEKYRYRRYYVDFSDVDINVCKERNKMRPEYKQVPDNVIDKMYSRLKTQGKTSGWVKVDREHFWEEIGTKIFDFNDYKKIHIFGDIHGCYSALKEYLILQDNDNVILNYDTELEKTINDNEMYIFCGDYLDRGLENKQVLELLIKLSKLPNVLFLEGNHELWLKMYANDEEESIRSRIFLNKTKYEIEDIDKADIRTLCRKLGQLAYFKYDNKVYFITHGGLNYIPEELQLIATDQFIHGVGDYNLDIDTYFANSNNNVIQIHGHRNMFDVDNVDVMTLLSNSKVRWIVNDFGNMVMRRTKHALLEIGKEVIVLEDCFKTRKRNTDYSDSVDEPFSEMFYYYRDEEFSGFSDYTALSSEFIDGGMLPYAIAIHLTYERAEDQIYIHHFVSDTNYDQSNVRLKFAEAARKIEPFFRDIARTSAVSELIDRADASDGYPGLGYLKKLSVKNHLELVSRIMR